MFAGSIIVTIGILLLVDKLVLGKIFVIYVLSEEAIVLKYFRVLPLVKLKYKDLISIRRITPIEATALGNMSVFISGVFKPLVFIKYGQRVTDTVVITPDNPDQFIAEVKRHIKEKTGRDI